MQVSDTRGLRPASSVGSWFELGPISIEKKLKRTTDIHRCPQMSTDIHRCPQILRNLFLIHFFILREFQTVVLGTSDQALVVQRATRFRNEAAKPPMRKSRKILMQNATSWLDWLIDLYWFIHSLCKAQSLFGNQKLSVWPLSQWKSLCRERKDREQDQSMEIWLDSTVLKLLKKQRNKPVPWQSGWIEAWVPICLFCLLMVHSIPIMHRCAEATIHTGSCTRYGQRLIRGAIMVYFFLFCKHFFECRSLDTERSQQFCSFQNSCTCRVLDMHGRDQNVRDLFVKAINILQSWVHRSTQKAGLFFEHSWSGGFFWSHWM